MARLETKDSSVPRGCVQWPDPHAMVARPLSTSRGTAAADSLDARALCAWSGRYVRYMYADVVSGTAPVEGGLDD